MSTEAHAAVASTILIAVVGFLLLLSPPMTGVRVALGMPEHLPGARFNPEVGAAEVLAPGEEGREYLGRLAMAYHAVFAALVYATLVPASRLLSEESARMALDLALVGAACTSLGGLRYAYGGGGFLWHGVFVAGLAVLFSAGLVFLLGIEPSGWVRANLQLTALLMLGGGAIGGWLGSSFVGGRGEFLQALAASRFDPDLAEGSAAWRALTGHEHAMMTLGLAAAVLVALSLMEHRGGRGDGVISWAFGTGQLLAAGASFAVWPVGKAAHLVITPAALVLLAAATAAVARARGPRLLRLGTAALAATLWVSVVVPGVAVAASLRKPLLFNPALRDPAWDWAELAYNVGHWHILMGVWGVTLLLVYLRWPNDLSDSPAARASGWAAVVGLSLAAAAANLYALGNPPGPYSPNPYSNPYLEFLLEPGLGIMALGVASGYLTALAGLARSALARRRGDGEGGD